MAKRKDIEITGGEAAASSSGAPEPAQAKSELPSVESPPISPATETPAIATDTPAPAIEPIAAATPTVEPITDAAIDRPARQGSHHAEGKPRAGEQVGAYPDRQDFRTARTCDRGGHRLDIGAADDGAGSDAAAVATSNAAHCRGGAPAARSPVCGGGLDHPRHPQWLRLRGKSRRALSSRARRSAARPRPGAIGQAAGRPLGGADAEGHHRVP